jgi:ribosomal protein S18 acetylase RimI-like enzyme
LRVDPARIEDLQAIVAELSAFWGDRDMAGLHQALYVHEFGDTALVLRGDPDDDEDGHIRAYLLGFVGPQGVGYIHVVAVRDEYRGEGLARRLYEEFERLARARGARALKAITSPGNGGSRSFHEALGFSVEEVERYSASGETRLVFRRELAGR